MNTTTKKIRFISSAIYTVFRIAGTVIFLTVVINEIIRMAKTGLY